MNTTIALMGIIGFAIVGLLVLAGVMMWFSRQIHAGPAPAPPPEAPPKLESVPTVAMAEAEPALTEATGLEQDVTHRRVVPLWLVVVYAIIIVWALWYIGTQVIPYFQVLAPQSAVAPAAAPVATATFVGAPVAPTPAAAPGKSNAANGAKLFESNGCGACHSLKEGEKIVGPPLFHIGQAAANRVKAGDYKGKAKTAEEYIRESIVEPNAYVVPGFTPGIMPQDFGKKLDAQDIDDLSAFLMTK